MSQQEKGSAASSNTSSCPPAIFPACFRCPSSASSVALASRDTLQSWGWPREATLPYGLCWLGNSPLAGLAAKGELIPKLGRTSGFKHPHLPCQNQHQCQGLCQAGRLLPALCCAVLPPPQALRGHLRGFEDLGTWAGDLHGAALHGEALHGEGRVQEERRGGKSVRVCICI